MKKIFTIFMILISIGLQAQDAAKEVFNEGVWSLKSKKYAEAEQKFSMAIARGVDDQVLKMAYIYKGFALNAQAQYEGAIICFTRAIELDTLDPATYTDRAKTYSNLKDYPNAIKDLEQVLKLQTVGEQAEAAYFYLGKIKMLTFENDEAIKYFTMLLILAPKDFEAYFLRGTAKSNIMDSDGAIADFDKAIELKGNYMEAYANRGVQKINKIPVNERIGKKMECLKEPCKDLLQAKALGDTSVDDMIELHCKKCK